MVKVVITWAGTEKEEYKFNTRKEAEKFVKDILGPCPTNVMAETYWTKNDEPDESQQ